MKDFDLNKLSGEDAKAIVRSLASGFQATIQKQQISSDKLISTLVLDLGVERTRNNPLKISFPFISVRVEEATDSSSFCRMIPVSIDSYQDDCLLQLNDSIEFDNGISNIYITNPIQTGKTMVLKFFTQARVRSGSLVEKSNQATNLITLGRHQVANDGFSFIWEGSCGVSVNGDNIQMNRIYPNSRFAVLDVPSSSYVLEIPKGYQAELLAFQTEITTALTTAASLAPAFGIWTSPLGGDSASSIYSSFSFNTGALLTLGQEFSGYITKDAFTNIVPVYTTIINEETRIYMKKSGVSITAGAVKLRILVRITKKVGA